MSILEKTFELSQFDGYREDNRREVKRADGSQRTTGLQNASKLRKEF